jgi:protein-S-isoprenylcysteine O-methyltransferase Ste14
MASPPWWKGSRGEWYVIVQFALLGLIALAPLWPGGRLVPARPAALALRGLGLLLGGLGLLLVLAGVATLGRNLSALPHPKQDAELVESGVYRWVRHPIYSGLVFGSFGWGLLALSWLALLLALALFFVLDAKARREERFLVAKFPAYHSYQRRVHKLIPFVY